MLSGLYAKWMWAWETRLTTRDTNRIVRPLEWGFDWLQPFAGECPGKFAGGECPPPLDRMIAINEDIVARSDEFFRYATPTDFRLERRHPRAVSHQRAAGDAGAGCGDEAPRRRRASWRRPISCASRRRCATPYPENDQVNARWYPAASREARASRSRP